MPDKGAMAGFALLHVYEATGNVVYLEEAIQIANVLANNRTMRRPIRSIESASF